MSERQDTPAQALLVALCLAGVTLGASDSPGLTVHLPRSVAVPHGTVTLGQVCVVVGPEALAEQARRIPLGRLYSSSQSLTLSRQQVLSRLACSGIRADQVRLSGAERVAVGRSGQSVSGDRLVGLARAYVLEQLKAPGLVATALHTPTALPLGADPNRVRLVTRPVGRSTVSQIRIRVSALADGLERGARDIVFRLRYPHHVAVAARSLAAGHTLTAADLSVQTELHDTPEPANWQPPLGQVVRRAVTPGTPLTAGRVVPPVVPVTVRRNGAVVIRIARPGLTITAMGRALADGHTGEVLKVKNIDSNRIIVCTVQDDGSVAPVL